MKHLRIALAGLLALLTASSAVAQTFPTVPYHTVIGRLGVSGDTGPSQAIPFATLAAQMGALTSTRSINTTAPLAGGGDLTVDRTLSITGLAGGVLAGSGPAFTRTPVLGASGTLGSLGFGNATSGIVTVQPVAGALGTVTFSLPAASGTAAVSATSPLVLGATSGALTCPTCVTSSGGGAITGTSPISVSAAGVVSITSPLPLTNGGSNASLTASNGGILWSNATQFQILAGTVTAGQCLLSGSTAAPTWGSCAGGASVTSIAANTGAFTLSTGITNSTNDIQLDKATAANLRAATSNKALTADNIFDAEVTVTFAASQTLDFSTFLNARITATANTTSLTCSNIKASQSGVITWVQDATGSRTMVAGWCSQFRWTNGTRGVLSTAINAIDALFYQCISTTICYVSLGKAQAN